jgi:outer membrane protein TolC
LVVTGLLVSGLLAASLPTARAQGPLSPKGPTGPMGPGPTANIPTVTPTVGPTTTTTATTLPTAAPTGTATGGPLAPGPSPNVAPTSAGPSDQPIAAAGTGLLAKKPEPEKPVVEPLSLAKAIKLADERAATIKMSADRLAMAEAQLDEVRFLPWSQWTMTGGVGVVPEIRGTAVYSPNGDISISSKLGPAWRVTVDGVVPLWTFGKITSGLAAAKANVELHMADIDRARNLVRHDVRRAYFGLRMARDARYLLELAEQKLADAIKHAEDNEDSDEADILRMKTYLMEVRARLGEVEKFDRIAAAGLRFLTGIEQPAPLAVPEEPIQPPKKPLSDVLVYLSSAKTHRPELKQVKFGVEARAAQVELAKARLYPDIGIGLQFGYASAPIITDQTNAFVIDQANFLRYGIGVVFRWNLDLLPAAARVRFAEAQLAEVRDQQKFAMGGVGVEVETAYGIAKDAAVREKFYGEAEALAKKWVATISAAIAVGTREDREMVDPLRAYLTNRYNHLQAIMDLNVAYSQLALATGDSSVAELE